MTFGAPGYLALLVLVPIIDVALIALIGWRSRAGARFGVPARPGVRVYVAPILLTAAIALAAIAAARPQFGDRDVTVEDSGIDLVVVLDVSQSMFATDSEPTRLRRAEAEIVAVLERLSGDRVGLVIFGGSAFVRSPLTADLVALSRIVTGVHEERGLVSPGSDLGAAIDEARGLIEGGAADAKAMLIISDGEDHGGRIVTAVADARSKGIAVYTAGAGTPEGAPVLDRDLESGEMIERRGEDGLVVVTRLDTGALERIAETGGGRYIALSGEGRPLTALAPEFDDLARTTFDRKESAERIERFPGFAAVALALVLIATVIAVPLPVPNRMLRLWPAAGAALFIAAVCGSSVAEVNRRGNRDYAAGNYAEAADAYRTAQALDPSRPEPYNNAGNALDRQGEFAAAIAEAKRALAAHNGDIEAQAEYALGNHYAGAEQLADALEAYKRSLLADPGDEDAKHNLEIIVRRLRTQPTAAPPTTTPPEISLTPTPGEGEPSGSGPSNATGTPGPSEPSGSPTPGAGGGEGTPLPGDLSDLSPEQLQRALEEALRGIDDEVTQEEALRILELLDVQNRQALDRPKEGGGSGQVPDY